MINKKTFVEALENIKKQEKRTIKLNDSLKEMSDSCFVFDSNNLYLMSLLDILSEIMHDDDDYIGWWLYEDVEKKVYINDIELDVSTPAKLYDFLVDNYDRKDCDKK